MYLKYCTTNTQTINTYQCKMFHHSRLEVKRKKKKGIICSQNSLSPTYCLTLSGFVLVVLWQHHLQQCCMAHPVQHCFMAYPVQHCFMAHPVQHCFMATPFTTLFSETSCTTLFYGNTSYNTVSWHTLFNTVL